MQDGIEFVRHQANSDMGLSSAGSGIVVRVWCHWCQCLRLIGVFCWKSWSDDQAKSSHHIHATRITSTGAEINFESLDDARVCSARIHMEDWLSRQGNSDPGNHSDSESELLRRASKDSDAETVTWHFWDWDEYLDIFPGVELTNKLQACPRIKGVQRGVPPSFLSMDKWNWGYQRCGCCPPIPYICNWHLAKKVAL